MDTIHTLLRILIHRKHTQDDILVLDIAGLHQLLEAVPVLSRVVGVDVGVHLQLLQFFVYIVLCHLLTLSGELVVQVHTTVGRGEGTHLDILQGQLLIPRVALRVSVPVWVAQTSPEWPAVWVVPSRKC